jgi:uncharacterized damage-inducible protein DinB
MYRTIEDFVYDWRTENQSTLKVLKTLTDASLTQKVNADGRSLGFLAWHLVLTLGEMGSKMAIQVNAPPENAPSPKTAAEIFTAYETASESIAKFVGTQWKDSMLEKEIELYGEKWKRGYALASLVKHEIHHRGQITVLMRQIGLKVPGVYGPSREEWAQLGIPPME